MGYEDDVCAAKKRSVAGSSVLGAVRGFRSALDFSCLLTLTRLFGFVDPPTTTVFEPAFTWTTPHELAQFIEFSYCGHYTYATSAVEPERLLLEDAKMYAVASHLSYPALTSASLARAKETVKEWERWEEYVDHGLDEIVEIVYSSTP